MNCKVATYKTLRNNDPEKTIWIPIDWKKIERETETLLFNMRIENTMPCECSECNLDTGNINHE